MIRKMTGSRMTILGEAMSILARSTRVPSSKSPARMRWNHRLPSVAREPKPRRIGACRADGRIVAVLARAEGFDTAECAL